MWILGHHQVFPRRRLSLCSLIQRPTLTPHPPRRVDKSVHISTNFQNYLLLWSCAIVHPMFQKTMAFTCGISEPSVLKVERGNPQHHSVIPRFIAVIDVSVVSLISVIRVQLTVKLYLRHWLIDCVSVTILWKKFSVPTKQVVNFTHYIGSFINHWAGIF